MGEHTPTPWVIGDISEEGEIAIMAVDGTYCPAVAIPCGIDGDKAPEVTKHHAKLIVQSVNAFAALAEHLGCKPEALNVDLVALVEAAQEARNYFEPLMDADQPSGSQPIPNDEMRLFLELDQALATLPRTEK